MLISPPFLPANSGAAVYDAQCVKDAMPGGLVGSGAYPVSQAMGWHGGIHVGSPASGEPVRAIADGWVVYRRENTETAYDGQTYSTGCVVIRHETEIGARLNAAGPATPTKFTYYSITLHLSTLDKDLPAVTKPIWRKDRLGTPGKINSQDNRIHFEIVCGDDDLKALVNRKTGRLALESDGRSDAVYGTTYIFVPQGAPLHAKMPAASSPGASTDLTTEDLVIGIDHEAGDVSLTTWRLAGAVAGSITEPNKAEYRLYEEAVARHKAMPANSSPSGWYELLRFGRNLGPDPLPAQAPHWRQIKLPDGSRKWIDLNTRATTKYSDADFPHWRGWRLVDDDVTDDDSRCDSKMIERLLNTTPEGEPIANDTPQSRANRLGASDVQSKLAKTICKFPTEWVKADVELRWKWLKDQGNPYNRQPLSEEDFAGFAEFAKKLCFWEELPEADKTRLTKKHWHFHPREFIAHMRKCGWLSNDEMTQCIPRNSPAGLVSRSTAYGRVLTLGQSINLMSRKFGLCSPIRLIHVLAQIWA
ncbi:MAG: hydroxyethylthiazole kinase, partial [Alcaligenaceae bacterium]